MSFQLQGINLVKELISFYGMSVTMAYMNYIQENAEVCVRDMLREISKKAEVWFSHVCMHLV